MMRLIFEVGAKRYVVEGVLGEDGVISHLKHGSPLNGITPQREIFLEIGSQLFGSVFKAFLRDIDVEPEDDGSNTRPDLPVIVEPR